MQLKWMGGGSPNSWVKEAGLTGPQILDFLVDLRLHDICFTRYCCGFKIHRAPAKIASGWRAWGGTEAFPLRLSTTVLEAA